MSVIKVNNLCINCLSKGHFVADCKSSHRCKRCQDPHHTLLHFVDKEPPGTQSGQQHSDTRAPHEQPEVSVNTATIQLKARSLLMTCQVMITAPNGSALKVRALLDSGSSASERLVLSLRLPRTRQKISITGIGGVSPSVGKSVTSLKVSSVNGGGGAMTITALVIPRVINNIPNIPLHSDVTWSHLSGLQLADPQFNIPGRVDVLLGIDVFVNVLLNGRRKGSPGAPVALETSYGWVLCGSVDPTVPPSTSLVTVCHSSLETTGDDIIHKFWEIEEPHNHEFSHLPQGERTTIQYFKDNHKRKPNGRFVVPLPKRADRKSIGESRFQAVRRFLSLERSLCAKGQFKEFDDVMQEYFELQHAELVPMEDFQKLPTQYLFYLPMHTVYKQTSTTTKIRAVFDASAKSTSGVSLNDTLVTGPTVHPPLLDVLLRFRSYRVAITADVSKMYRAIELTSEDKDLHRFVWRATPSLH